MCVRCKYKWVGRTNTTGRLLVFGERIFTLLVEALNGVEEFLDLRLSSASWCQFTSPDDSDEDWPGVRPLPFRTRL